MQIFEAKFTTQFTNLLKVKINLGSQVLAPSFYVIANFQTTYITAQNYLFIRNVSTK